MSTVRSREAAKRKLRNGRTAEDITWLETRAGVLVGEVVNLEARAGSIRGFLETAPLMGERRYHEAAGVAVGAAVAGTRDAGAEGVARAVRDTARAIGSTEKVSALLDLAGAALAWATVLSLADEEAGAGMPSKAYARDSRPGAIDRGVAGGRVPTPAALRAVADGSLSAHHVFLGRTTATQRRELATLSVAHIILADPRIPAMDWAWEIVEPMTLVGHLTPEDRHDLAASALQVHELEVAW